MFYVIGRRFRTVDAKVERTVNRRDLYFAALDLDRGEDAHTVRSSLPLLLSAIFVMLRASTRPARWLTHTPKRPTTWH